MDAPTKKKVNLILANSHCRHVAIRKAVQRLRSNAHRRRYLQWQLCRGVENYLQRWGKRYLKQWVQWSQQQRYRDHRERIARVFHQLHLMKQVYSSWKYWSLRKAIKNIRRDRAVSYHRRAVQGRIFSAWTEFTIVKGRKRLEEGRLLVTALSHLKQKKIRRYFLYLKSYYLTRLLKALNNARARQFRNRKLLQFGFDRFQEYLTLHRQRRERNAIAISFHYSVLSAKGFVAWKWWTVNRHRKAEQLCRGLTLWCNRLRRLGIRRLKQAVARKKFHDTQFERSQQVRQRLLARAAITAWRHGAHCVEEVQQRRWITQQRLHRMFQGLFALRMRRYFLQWRDTAAILSCSPSGGSGTTRGFPLGSFQHEGGYDNPHSRSTHPWEQVRTALAEAEQLLSAAPVLLPLTQVPRINDRVPLHKEESKASEALPRPDPPEPSETNRPLHPHHSRPKQQRPPPRRLPEP